MALGAIIGAGASLLGGLFGKKKQPKETPADVNSRLALMGQAQGARDASEKYGFNPLTLLGASSAVGPSYTTSENYMGNAIADAGMILADHISGKKEAGQITQLKEQNETLRKQIQDQTLRPKVGGIYARREAVATTAQALGRNANGRFSSALRESVSGGAGGSIPSGDAGGALGPLPENYGIDPRREVDQKKIEPHSGFMVVDNPYFPTLYFPTLDGDEAMNVLQAPLIPWSIAGSKVAQRFKGRVDEYRDKKARPKPKPSKPAWQRQRGTGPSPHNPVYPR